MRQALAYAIDADEIIKGVMDGKAVRVATMLPSLHFGYDASLKPIKQDLARSKKLLAEAGFPNGVEIVLNGPQGRYVRDKEVGGGGRRPAQQGGDQDHAADLRVRELPEQHGLRPQGGPGVAHRLGPSDDGRGGDLRAALQVARDLRELANEDFNGMVEQAQSQMDEKKRYAEYQRSTSSGSRRSPRSRSTSRSISTGPTSGSTGRPAATS